MATKNFSASEVRGKAFALISRMNADEAARLVADQARAVVKWRSKWWNKVFRANWTDGAVKLSLQSHICKEGWLCEAIHWPIANSYWSNKKVALWKILELASSGDGAITLTDTDYNILTTKVEA